MDFSPISRFRPLTKEIKCEPTAERRFGAFGHLTNLGNVAANVSDMPDFEEATIEEIDTADEAACDVKLEVVEHNDQPQVASVFVGNSHDIIDVT